MAVFTAFNILANYKFPLNEASGIKTGTKMKEELIEIYRQCMEQRKHYDILSWSIGGVAILIDGVIIKWSFEQSLPELNTVAVLIVNLIGIFLMYCWYSIYERNRMFVEVANELARDIEREWGIDGIGIKNGKYSVGPNKGVVEFKNTDANKNKYAEPDTEEQKDISSHFNIRYLMVLIVFIHLVAIVQCLTIAST